LQAVLITAILDTNVFIQAAIGLPRSASLRALRAYDDGKYRLVFSPATLDELLNALLVPHLRARHGWSDDQILRFTLSFLPGADIYPGRQPISAALPRDLTDSKLLALAEESDADFLVTNDRRHLLRLRQYGRTRILTPAKFLKELNQTSSS
jgi:putative PIN family toxin of toxin-antitoxin system